MLCLLLLRSSPLYPARLRRYDAERGGIGGGGDRHVHPHVESHGRTILRRHGRFRRRTRRLGHYIGEYCTIVARYLPYRTTNCTVASR